MNLDMNKTFILEGDRGSNDHYLDFELYDTCNKSKKRMWIITYDKTKQDWYGILCRSNTEEDEFNKYVYLPKKFVDLFVNHIGAIDHELYF